MVTKEERKETQTFVEKMNKIIGEEFGHLFPRSANYLYWDDKKGNQYFYTTEKVNTGNGKTKYASGVYRFIKSKDQYKLTRQSFHSSRWRATERAYKMLCKADGITYEPYTAAGQKREKERLEKELGKIHG